MGMSTACCKAAINMATNSDVLPWLQEAMGKLQQSLKPWRVDTYAAYTAHRGAQLLEEEKEREIAGVRVGDKRPRDAAASANSDRKKKSMCTVM